MLGPEGVTRGVFLHATATLPGRLAQMRERYSAPVSELPDFANYYPDEVATLSIEKFPALAITIPNTTGTLGNRNTDIDADFEEYSYRYNVRMYVYAMAATGPATSKAIKRYALAVREAFLADKILPVEDGNDAVIDPKSLVESYSELDKNDGQFIAAAMVQFEILTHEQLAAIHPFDGPADIVPAVAVTQHPYFDD